VNGQLGYAWLTEANTLAYCFREYGLTSLEHVENKIYLCLPERAAATKIIKMKNASSSDKKIPRDWRQCCNSFSFVGEVDLR
jgi:hypothetical protein